MNGHGVFDRITKIHLVPDLAKPAPLRAKAALSSGVKIFVATLSAILVAAGICYLIYQDHQSTAAHDALDEYMRLHPVPNYGSSDYLPKPPPPVPDKSLAWLTASLQIKTSDGLITIPKGAVVRIVPEKSKPGTIAINYNGYVASIRSDAITQASR